MIDLKGRLGAICSPARRPALPPLFAAVGVTLLAISGPVSAQSEAPTGSRIGRPAPAYIPDNARLTPEERGLVTVQEFGRCLIQTDASGFYTEALALPSRRFTEAQRRRIIGSSCLGEGSLSFTYDVLRGALSRARYMRSWEKGSTVPFGEPIDYFEGINPANASERNAASLLDFGGCVVRADRVNTHIFVVAQPGSGKFNAALQELIPQLGPCMFEGMEVQFSKTNLITILSEALYWETAKAHEAAAG